MKKYLIQGALALVASATLVSCHVDDDFSTSIVSEKFKAYEQVFEEEFGKINPNQDWGFGEASQATRTRAAQTRGIAKAMPTKPNKFRDTAPDMPSYYNTSKEVKDNVNRFSGDINNLSGGETIYFDANSEVYNLQNRDNLIIYIVGNVTLNQGTSANGTGTKICVTNGSKLTITYSISNNLQIYLAPSATLDLTGVKDWQGNEVVANFQNPYSGIYLNSGSVVKAKGLSFYASSTVYNKGGRLEASALDVHDGSLFYNDGTLAVSGAIVTHNTDAEIINKGTLTGASLEVSAGARMHNLENATVKVSGKTFVDNSNSQWMNDGDYTSGNFEITASGYDVWNNCMLTVTAKDTKGSGNFFLNRATFVLDGGASVIADSFTWEDTSSFYLGGKSLLDVAGELKTNNYNSGYGFHGESSDYSVIRAGRITKGKGDVQYSMSYYGNLYIDTNTHFAQGYINKDGQQQPYYYYDSTVKLKFENQTLPEGFKIEKSKCNPGYPSGTTTDEVTIPVITEKSYIQRTYKQYRYKTTQYDCGRIMCEDLGKVSASDIDFNDVVFDAYIYNMVPVSRTRITKIENGSETEIQGWGNWSEDTEYASKTYKATDIYLLAGGGTIPVTVAGVDLKNAYNTSHTMLINTVDDSDEDDAKTYGNVYDNSQSYKQPADLKDLRNINTLKDIKIVVKYGSQVYELEAYKGAAPHKICVPIGTRWPYERVEINQAYSFEDYVKTYTPTDTTVTYNGDESKVVKEIIDAAKNIVGYYIDESNKEVWTASPTTEQNKNRYQGSVAGSPVPYTARAIDSLLDRTSGDGLPEDNQYTEETVTISSGYNSGDPVLVRRRH